MARGQITFGVSIPDHYGSLVEYAQEAESLGFERLSLGEHIMDGNPPRPTLLSIPALAAAAGATSRIRLLTGIVLIPLYHPVLLAKLATTLDVISGGRLDFGVGVGGQRDTRVEFEALGVPVEQRGRRANEALRLIKQLWTEEDVSFQGRYFQCEGVTLRPHPIQRPHPPVWVAGREEAAMKRAANYGDGWYPYLFTVRRLGSSIESVRKYAVEAGRDLADFRWGLLQPTCVSDSKEEAIRIAADNVGRRYVTAERSAEDIAQALCITGTPEDCIKEIEKRIEVGVTDITLQWVAPDAASAREQMGMAARSILPYFKD